MIERVRLEQRIARDWLAANGYDHPDAFLARLGASDWVGEEVILMGDKVKVIKVRYPDVAGPNKWCAYRLVRFNVSDEFEGAEIGDRIELELCEMTEAELDALPEFTGW